MTDPRLTSITTTATTVNAHPNAETTAAWISRDPFCPTCGGARAGSVVWVGGMEVQPCRCPVTSGYVQVITSGTTANTLKASDLAISGTTWQGLPIIAADGDAEVERLFDASAQRPLDPDEAVLYDLLDLDGLPPPATPAQEAAAEEHIKRFWWDAARGPNAQAIRDALWGEPTAEQRLRAVLAELGEPKDHTIWRCTCGAGHFLLIDNSPVEDETEIYFTVEDYTNAPSWRWRLATIWKVLWGKQPHVTWYETILRPDEALGMARAILDRVAVAREREAQRDRA